MTVGREEDQKVRSEKVETEDRVAVKTKTAALQETRNGRTVGQWDGGTTRTE